MNKKIILKITIIVLIIIHLLTINHFGFNLIRNVRLVKENGKMYFLYPAGNDCTLREIDNVLFPKELSYEYINNSDYIEELKKNSINISSIYRIIQFSELALIVLLIIYYKKEDNGHYIRNYKL